MKQIIKYFFVSLLIFYSSLAISSDSNQTIEQTYYCWEDFALKMSGGDWYLV